MVAVFHLSVVKNGFLDWVIIYSIIETQRFILEERENRVKVARRNCWQQGDMCSLAVSRKVDKVHHTKQKNANDSKETEDMD